MLLPFVETPLAFSTLSVSTRVMRMVQALSKAFRKAWALAAVLLLLICTNTQRVARFDGHEQVAASVLVLHLRQVLHIHMDVARLVALECLGLCLGFTRLERIEVAHAVAAQTPVKPERETLSHVTARRSSRGNSRVPLNDRKQPIAYLDG